MKCFKKIIFLFSLICATYLFFGTINVSADISVNMNGATGAAANRCNDSYNVCWPRVANKYSSTGYANDDGIRISIFKMKEDGTVDSFVAYGDFSNQEHENIGFISYSNKSNIRFSKFHYKSVNYAASLSLSLAGYNGNFKTTNLPWVVRASDGATNLNDLITYFSDEQRINFIANRMGIAYSELKGLYPNGNAKYKILLEPIAYVDVKYNNKYYTVALTVTEMAMFDTNGGNNLFSNVSRNIYYNTFPKAMFLSKNDDALGFSAFNPPSNALSASDIKKYMGVAIIDFSKGQTNESQTEITTAAGEYVYRYDTDVFTSLKISINDKDHTKNNPLYVKFILGSSGDILCDYTALEVPKDQDQLAYCGWHTPTKDYGYVKDKVGVYVNGYLFAQINIYFQDADSNIPPDPKADDEKPFNWRLENVNLSNDNQDLSLKKTWDVWYSENNHFDGTLNTGYKTWTGMGSHVTVDHYTNYERDYIEPYCSISKDNKSNSITNKVDCEKNKGTWHNGYYTSWRAVGTYESVVSNISNDYRFYKFGTYYISSSSSYEKRASSTYKTVGTKTKYVANDDKTKPYKDTFEVAMTNIKSDIINDPNGDPFGTPEEISSGYGIIANNSVGLTAHRVSTGFGKGSSYQAVHTGIQNCFATFSEFKFLNYKRALELISGSNSISAASSGTYKFEFKKNKYDIGNERTHFSPIWYPDNTDWIVKFQYLDLWTPAGQIRYYDSDSININGNMYEDYRVVEGN